MAGESGGAGVAGEKRRYRSREERRAEIVDATLSILVEEGMHAWTTAALAERVGCSEATLFKHFEGKDEILTEALRQQARALRRRIGEFEPEGSGPEKAGGLVVHILDWVAEARGGPLVILLGHATRIHPEMGDEVAKTMGRLRDRLESFLADVPEPTVLAQLFIAVGHSSALRWMISDRRGTPDEIARPMLGLLEAWAAGEEGR